MKILIVGPSWVGDMVMSQSLYILLKNQYPHATIDVLAPSWSKGILKRMPEVNKAITMPYGHGEFSFSGYYSIAKTLREERYDRAYILPKSIKSSLIPWLARIPTRTGWRGEFRYGLLNDIRSNIDNFVFMVERYAALAFPKEKMFDSKALNDLVTTPNPSLSVNLESQNATLKKLNLTQERDAIALCPGAEFGPAKKWPEAHYAATAEHICKEGKQVWLFGSANDLAACQNIKKLVDVKYQENVHVLSGKTDLTEAVDLLALCKTAISNDSGLLHIAAAVGCHMVAIYGSGSPRYTPPLTDKLSIVHSDIECRPCFQRTCPYGHLDCLNKLLPEQVIKSL